MKALIANSGLQAKDLSARIFWLWRNQRAMGRVFGCWAFSQTLELFSKPSISSVSQVSEKGCPTFYWKLWPWRYRSSLHGAAVSKHLVGAERIWCSYQRVKSIRLR